MGGGRWGAATSHSGGCRHGCSFKPHVSTGGGRLTSNASRVSLAVSATPSPRARGAEVVIPKQDKGHRRWTAKPRGLARRFTYGRPRSLGIARW